MKIRGSFRADDSFEFTLEHNGSTTIVGIDSTLMPDKARRMLLEVVAHELAIGARALEKATQS